MEYQTPAARQIRSEADTVDADAIYRKLAWRLLPLLMLSYLVAYLDRVNISYAQLQMKELLHFSDVVYGLGAGIFFVGYFLCEVPSNLLLQKIGARKSLLRIMLCWGVVAAAMMLVQTPLQFYLMRFALGVFEAGFFPGVILYFTYWFPRQRRGKMLALFMTAPIVASLISGPLCGAILHYLDQCRGWAGWQWLFLLQGLPAVLLGVAVYLRLDDRPQHATWLSAAEKALIEQALAADAAERTAAPGKLLGDPRLYALALVNFLMVGATYALVFWAPSLIKSWGVLDIALIGWYSILPNVAGIIGMLVIVRHSDRRAERRWHYVACVALLSLGLAAMIAAGGRLWPSLLGMSVAMVGVAATTPVFITMTSEYFRNEAAAAGIAIVTSAGILGASASAVATGVISSRYGLLHILYLVMALFLLSALLLLASTCRQRAGQVPPRSA